MTLYGTEWVRPSFETIYMRMAQMISLRSTCRRRGSSGERMNVGCVIVTPDFRKVISLGFNGNASGLPNRCDSDEPGSCSCLHGEENAIISCDVPRATPKVVFSTHLPCPMCAKRLINLGGVQKVFYHHDYRIRRGLELLDTVGILNEQLVLEEP